MCQEVYTVTSNYKTFDYNVTVYTNNIKKHWVLTSFKKHWVLPSSKKKCIPLHHGQSLVKKYNGIHAMQGKKCLMSSVLFTSAVLNSLYIYMCF